MKRCADIQAVILRYMDTSGLESVDKEHLANCTSCSQFMDEIRVLKRELSNHTVRSLSPLEFARMQSKLDENINHYQKQAQRTYNFALRYSAIAAAAALLLFVILVNRLQIPGFHIGGQPEIAIVTDTADGGQSLSIGYDIDSDVYSIDEAYLHVVVSDYISIYGFNTSDQLLGDLSAEELEYLKNNLKVGDIL